ncbi:MAG: DUF5667 domain-containing protein [bacterium]
MVFEANRIYRTDRSYRIYGIVPILRPVVAVCLILAIIFSGSVITVQAAKNSLPGQFLYPLKIALEKGRVAIAPKQENKVKLEVEFAEQRVKELAQLVEKHEPERITETVEDFQNKLDLIQVGLQKIGKDDKIKEIEEVVKIVEIKSKEIEDILNETDKKTEDLETKKVLAQAKKHLTEKIFVMALDAGNAGDVESAGDVGDETVEVTEEVVTQTAVITGTVEEEIEIRNSKSEIRNSKKEEVLEEPEVKSDFKGGLLMEPEQGVYGGLLKN